MTNQPTESESNGHDRLTAGLRAAFAATTQAGPALKGAVLTALEDTVGPFAPVLLRDAPDEQVPLVLPPHESSDSRPELHRRYQVMGEIARGGVGVVMKSRDADLGRDVAMKVLRTDHRDNSAMVHRFVEEAQIAGQLQHPGILPVYELGLYDDRTPFFTMKLVKGQTLSTLLADRNDTRHERARFLTIFEQVCQTLAFAHTKGVIHRDLKPSNIMVGAFGEVQVVDWGLAKVLRAGERDEVQEPAGAPDDESVVQTVRSDAATHSVAGSVMGTPAYMSPEQASGEVHLLDERSDVFSLGAILFEVLSGRSLYAGPRDGVLRQAREADLHAAFERLDGADADAELVDVAKRCLSPDRALRPRDAGVLANEVADYLESLEARAREAQLAAARAETKAGEERRARRLTLALVASILLALILGGGGWYAVQKERNEQVQERSLMITDAIGTASEALGRATAAQVGHREPWIEVNAAAERIRDLLRQGRLEPAVAARAEELLARIETADRDRRITERIEEVVMMGATHQDKHSWLWMEKALRAAFLDYGIDLEYLTPKETAVRIRESELAPQLTDGLELWAGTRAHLATIGDGRLSIEDTIKWLPALYEADPDPFAAKVRKLVYAHQPTRNDVVQLAESVHFADVRPRTLAWLGSAAYRTGDMELIKEILDEAVLLYPDDFMLTFDYAYILAEAEAWDDAIRYYERCLAIRPRSGGVWRSLGIAFRKTGELEASKDAIKRSIEHQPDHGPTYVDLGVTLEALGDVASAIEAYERALELRPDLEEVRSRLEALMENSNQKRREE